MQAFDDELTRLMLAAQRHPPLSERRQETLEALFQETQRSGRLWQPRDNFDKDVYEDAVQELFLYICEKVEKYDPSRAPFLGWVNMLLSKRFYILALSIANERYIRRFTTSYEVDELANAQSSDEEVPLLMEQVKQCINYELKELLQSKHMKERPEVNIQILLQRRLAKEKWKDISADLEIQITSLHNFYQRTLEKIRPIIKNCVGQ